MSHPEVRKLARAFGATILVNQPGVKGSLRREATRAGVPTILFEAGEAGRFSNRVSQSGLHGVLNVMAEMGMWMDKQRVKPPFQVIVRESEWIRAEKGGILDLNVRPGELIYKDDVIGSILNPFGKTVTEIRAPCTGIIIGITTQPITVPGTGIAHVARLKKTLASVERSLEKAARAKRKRRRRPLKKKLKRVSA
jgi:predicted deacylase